MFKLLTKALNYLNNELDEKLEQQRYDLAKAKQERPQIIAKAKEQIDKDLAKIQAESKRLTYLANQPILSNDEALELQLLLEL